MEQKEINGEQAMESTESVSSEERGSSEIRSEGVYASLGGENTGANSGQVTGAPTKMLKTNWLVVILRLVALVVGTTATIIAAQLFVGNIMLALLGAERLSSPMWSAIYSALSYIVVILILVFLPGQLKKIGKADKKELTSPHNEMAAAINTPLNGQAGSIASNVAGVYGGVVSDDLNATATKATAANTKKHGKTIILDDLGLRGWPTWTDIGLALVGYIAYLLLASVVMMVFMTLFPWFNAEEVQDVGFSSSVAGVERVLAFITLVVVAPVAEEVIFRGWLYDKIKCELASRVPKWAELTVAVLLTSVLFGFVHLQWNVGVNVFALSVILCLLREITGTTYAGILLHALKNGVAFYLLFVLRVS